MQLNKWSYRVPFVIYYTHNLPALQALVMQESFQAVNAALFNSDKIYCNSPSEI